MENRWPQKEVLGISTLHDGPSAGGQAQRTVSLPAPWPPGGPAVRTYGFALGSPLQREPGERLRLRFDACATEAQVFLDGRHLGGHLGDWVPFEVEIPEDHAGPGRLHVVVDSRPGHPTRGFLPSLGLVHGGLWQEMAMLRTGPHVLLREQVSVRPHAGGVRVAAPVDGRGPFRLRFEVRERSGPDGVVMGRPIATADSDGGPVEIDAPALRRWSPEVPWLYEVRIAVEDAQGRVSDRTIVPFGVRTVATDGDRLLLNGRPRLLRGLLHWGYYPEIGAPNPDRRALRREFEHLRLRGFNAVKCCLFVPPRAFLDVADEMGILVWQEYPLWLAPLAGPELRREYEGFFRHDRHHPSVILRTLTCENDAVDEATLAGLGVLGRELLLPGELVADNSAWLALSRTGDFYDEHPYLHNAQWDAYLARTRAVLQRLPRKPLLLGETMAADALPAVADLSGSSPPLYAPAYARILQEWSADGQEPEGLRHRALRTAEAVRRFQIERLRLRLPGAGYVLNASRDVPLCPCGFADAAGRPKFPLESCAGQHDTMPLADLPRRSFEPGEPVAVPLWVSHFGREPLRLGQPAWFCGEARGELAGVHEVPPGSNVLLGEARWTFPERSEPRAESLEVDLDASEAGLPAWTVWAVPRAAVPPEVTVTGSLTEALPVLARGGAVVLLAAQPVAGGWKAPEFVFWSFIPHLPQHPLWATAVAPGPFPGIPSTYREIRRALRGETLARALVEDLLPFDLLSGRVLEWSPGAGTPVLEILDLHGTPGEARRRPLILEARVGRGRLLVSALEHEDSPAGRWLLAELARQLLREPFEVPAMDRPRLAETVMLDGPWWMEKAGRTVSTGTPRRTRGANVFEGWETFTGNVVLPVSWAGRKVFLRAEAVGDTYEILVDGRRLLLAGDEHGVLHGMRDVPATYDVSGTFAPGVTHAISFRIRDWRGGGGLVGPVYLTTEDPEGRFTY